MWSQLSLGELISSYKIVLYPLVLFMLLAGLPMPLYMILGRWRRW